MMDFGGSGGSGGWSTPRNHCRSGNSRQRSKPCSARWPRRNRSAKPRPEPRLQRKKRRLRTTHSTTSLRRRSRIRATNTEYHHRVGSTCRGQPPAVFLHVSHVSEVSDFLLLL